MSANEAAYLVKTGAFEVRPAPLAQPGAGEVRVKVEYVTVGPLEAIQFGMGYMVDHYPSILGCDVAGVVEAVGEGIDAAAVGQRVLGITAVFQTAKDEHGAYQRHAILKHAWTCPLPDGVSTEAACVLPLGVIVPALGLFGKSFLGLDPPSDALPGPPRDKGVVVVTGGASSVGLVGVQLCRAAGYRVVATASSGTADLVRQLGADAVVDYKGDGVTDKIVAAVRGLGDLKGIYHTAGRDLASFAALRDVQDALGLAGVVVASANPVPEGAPVDARFIATPLFFGAEGALGDLFFGLGTARAWIARALTSGALVPAPRAVVVGRGLETVQTAVARYCQGAPSAAKLVVQL